MAMRQFLQFSLILFLLAKPGFAQHSYSADTFDFAPRARVIFEDDFSQDAVGTFPSKWWPHKMLLTDDPAKNIPSGVKVGSENGSQILEIKDGTMLLIVPAMAKGAYLPESFTIEYDCSFYFPDTRVIEAKTYLEFVDTIGNLHYASIGVNDKGIYVYLDVLRNSSHKAAIPGNFDADTWHHMAYSYNKGRLGVYVDDHRLFVIPKCGYVPASFWVHCWAPVKYRNFRVATGPEKNTFTTLLTQKTFVSHDIHFDVDKSEIKPESNGYLIELARLLRDHPDVKIEIAGHTDNDGNATHNLALSLARANAVKARLAALGTDPNRLTTRGLGQNQPLQPNTSPANKAMNRRVEFTRK
jgi:OmpA-OmpF porin, OOP family